MQSSTQSGRVSGVTETAPAVKEKQKKLFGQRGQHLSLGGQKAAENILQKYLAVCVFTT